MKSQLNKKIIERFSRQIIIKDIGVLGQKKIIFSKEKTDLSLSDFCERNFIKT